MQLWEVGVLATTWLWIPFAPTTTGCRTAAIQTILGCMTASIPMCLVCFCSAQPPSVVLRCLMSACNGFEAMSAVLPFATHWLGHVDLVTLARSVLTLG